MSRDDSSLSLRAPVWETVFCPLPLARPSGALYIERIFLLRLCINQPIHYLHLYQSLYSNTSAGSSVKRRYRWVPKMTRFWRFSSGLGKNRKNELSGTESPLKVSFAGFLVEPAPSLVASSGYPAQRKRKYPCHLPALAAVIVDCISSGLCFSSVPRIRCEEYHHRSGWWGGLRTSRGHRQPLLGPTPNAPFLARPPSYAS